jgi:O-antigen/teichoic acid export membrane protein
LVYITMLNSHIAVYLNLILFMPMLIYYLFVFLFIIRKFRLSISLVEFSIMKQKIKENFYVTFNGSSVVLQQSIFMFAAAGAAGPQTLGAYGIIDKLLGVVRQIVSAFSSAIYPRAAQFYNEGVEKWIVFRNTIQKGYAVVFIILACLIVLLSSTCSIVFTGKEDPTLTLFFKYFSLAPLALALNANNVLELLLKKDYRQMFDISILIIIATGTISFFLIRFFDGTAIGLYPLIIESLCLLIYSFSLRRIKSKAIE